MSKKDRFKILFAKFIEEGAKYVGVYIKTPHLTEKELVLNPIVNAEKKLDYYMRAYNDNMQLKSINNIEIVAITGAIYLEDLEDNTIAL